MANQMKLPRGDPPTNTTGSLHGWGRSTVASMVESPAMLAGAPAVSTFTTPWGVMQLTTAWNGVIGFLPATTTIKPLTVTDTWPWRSTEPVPETMLHAAPPPGMPRSVTGGCPTGVIESNSISVLPSSAPTLTAPAPSRLSAPIPPTTNFRQRAIAQHLHQRPPATA